MTTSARWVVACLVLVPFDTPAGAVCFEPRPRVCAEFFASDVVIAGTVISVSVTVPRDGRYDGWTYRLRVARTFRGPVREYVEVFTENSSERLPLRMGRRYLLFAHASRGRLEINDCGNAGPLRERGEEIREIERLGAAETSLVEGRVVGRPDWLGVPGLGFRIRGKDRTYSAVSGADGWFRVVVRPGSYSVEADNVALVPFDLSYDDPRHISLARGQCGEVQFVYERPELGGLTKK